MNRTCFLALAAASSLACGSVLDIGGDEDGSGDGGSGDGGSGSGGDGGGATGTGAIGDPCASGADCRSGECGGEALGFPGGYCTLTGCAADEDCPAGSHCDLLQGGPPLCVRSCHFENDCRDAYTCEVVDGASAGSCVPAAGTGGVGTPCLYHFACEGYCEPSIGACTEQCAPIAIECPAGSHCREFYDALDPRAGRLFCLPDCIAGEGCQAGAQCTDWDQNGVNECLPPCEGSGHCPTPFEPRCEPSGTCGGCASADDCARFGDRPLCGDDGTCVACRSDADCPAGGTCRASDAGPVCGGRGDGSGAAGTPCADGTDCASGTCATEAGGFRGGYCLGSSCAADGDCAAGEHCSEVGGGSCLADCRADAECRDGYGCVDADRDRATECWPSGTGRGAIGDPCTGVWDCAGGEDAECLLADPFTMTSYCSRPCTQAGSAGCDLGSHCGIPSLFEQTLHCLPSCSGDGDCRTQDGFRCADGDLDGLKECTTSVFP